MKGKLWKLVLVGLLVICAITAYGDARPGAVDDTEDQLDDGQNGFLNNSFNETDDAYYSGFNTSPLATADLFNVTSEYVDNITDKAHTEEQYTTQKYTTEASYDEYATLSTDRDYGSATDAITANINTSDDDTSDDTSDVDHLTSTVSVTDDTITLEDGKEMSTVENVEERTSSTVSYHTSKPVTWTESKIESQNTETIEPSGTSETHTDVLMINPYQEVTTNVEDLSQTPEILTDLETTNGKTNNTATTEAVTDLITREDATETVTMDDVTDTVTTDDTKDGVTTDDVINTIKTDDTTGTITFGVTAGDTTDVVTTYDVTNGVATDDVIDTVTRDDTTDAATLYGVTDSVTTDEDVTETTVAVTIYDVTDAVTTDSLINTVTTGDITDKVTADDVTDKISTYETDLATQYAVTDSVTTDAATADIVTHKVSTYETTDAVTTDSLINTVTTGDTTDTTDDVTNKISTYETTDAAFDTVTTDDTTDVVTLYGVTDSVTTDAVVDMVTTGDTTDTVTTYDVTNAVTTENVIYTVTTDDTTAAVTPYDMTDALTTGDVVDKVTTDDTTAAVTTYDMTDALTTEDVIYTVTTDDTTDAVTPYDVTDADTTYMVTDTVTTDIIDEDTTDSMTAMTIPEASTSTIRYYNEYTATDSDLGDTTLDFLTDRTTERNDYVTSSEESSNVDATTESVTTYFPTEGGSRNQSRELEGFWVGWFLCGDKNFSFEMNVTDVSNGGQIQGVLKFDGPGNSGSHFINGLAVQADFIISFGDWISEGTYAITGHGSISEDGLSFSGEIGGDCESDTRTLYARRYLGEHTLVGNLLDQYVSTQYVGNEEENYIIIMDNNFFGDGVMTSFAARFINTNPVTFMVVRPESSAMRNFEIIHSFDFQPKNLTEYGTIQGVSLENCPKVQEGDRLAFTNLNGGDGGGPVTYVGDMGYMFKWFRYEYTTDKSVPEVGDKLNVSRMIHPNRFFAMATYAPEILCGEQVEPYVITTTTRQPTTTTTTPPATTTSSATTTVAPTTTVPVTTSSGAAETTTMNTTETTTTHNSNLTTTTVTPTTPVTPSIATDPGPDGGDNDGQCTVISNLNVKCESAVSNPNGEGSEMPWDSPPRDCSDVLRKGATESGPYFIRPYFGSTVSPDTIQVYCHFEDGKAWTTVLRRLDGAIDFSECKLDGGCLEEGTGHYFYEYWIGLKKLHIITQDKSYKLRVSMETFSGSSVFAEYSIFWLNNYANYRLHIGGYSGISGDSLGLQNRMKFTSACRDVAGQVGWIETADGSCETHANLFGPYSSDCGDNNNCIFWDTIPAEPNGKNRAIKTLEVKITPN